LVKEGMPALFLIDGIQLARRRLDPGARPG
jgi:hypothetical protein